MCWDHYDRSIGLNFVRLYTFTNLLVLIFSIVHFVSAFNPSNYINDLDNYYINYQNDLGLQLMGVASRYLCLFLFNVMNSIMLWYQFSTGGIKERVLFEAVCYLLSYLELFIESIYLLVTPSTFLATVVPNFVFMLILFGLSIYIFVVIVLTSDKVEELYIKNMNEANKIQSVQNNKNEQIEIAFEQNQNKNNALTKKTIEEGKANEGIEMNTKKISAATKFG
jgi:hypothetical protein